MQDLWVDKISKNKCYKPYIYSQRDSSHKIYPSYERGYDRGRGNFRWRPYDRNRKNTLHSEPNAEVITIQESHTEDNNRDRGDNSIRGLEVNSDPL